MQITQSEKFDPTLLVVAASTVAVYLQFAWSSWLAGGFLFLAVLLSLARFDGADAPATRDGAPSTFDELFPDETAAVSIWSAPTLRPEDLFMLGDGLLGGDSWDDGGGSIGFSESMP